MSTKNINNKMFWRIVAMVFLACIIPFSIISGQLFILQIKDHEKYEERAIDQQTRDTIITPKRGAIYDRNLKPLAVSATVETIYINPSLIKTKEQEELIAKNLSEILGLDYNKVLSQTKMKKRYYEIIAKKVEKPQADKVRAFISQNKLKSISIAENTKRYYPNANFAASIIGWTNEDNVGQYGIESFYESILKGVPGRIITAKNVKGNEMPFKYEQYYDAQNGLNVVLTIDETIQYILGKHLEQALIERQCKSRVTGIVMNVKTGEILAMDTKGDYDLNNPRKIDDQILLDMIAQAPIDKKNDATLNALFSMWRNKAVQDTYEPGSVFKIITASMALEEKVVKLDETFSCPGYRIVSGVRIGCWKAGGHGTETFVQGVGNSCNPVFMDVARRVGEDKFLEYMKAFGFMEKTGIDLPAEAESITHDRKNFKELELSIASFGQRFRITPIQLITAVSAVANGGKLMKPYIVKEYVDDNKNIKKMNQPEVIRQVISAETSKTMNFILESVVSKGTGKNAYVSGFHVGGKTGTSQKFNDEQEDVGRIASFLGVAPMNDPQIAVLVLLDDPQSYLKQGGQIAAPVVGRIMAEVLPYLDVKPSYTEEELKKLDVLVPNALNLAGNEIDKLFTKLGLKFKRVGTGNKVSDQMPSPGVRIPRNSEVILYMGTSKPQNQVKIPSVIGMSYTQAMNALKNSGLYMEAFGAINSIKTTGVVSAIRQEPKEGSMASVGSVVTVEFNDPYQTGE